MGSGLSQEEPVEEEIVSEAHAALFIHGFLPNSKFDEFEEFDVLVVSSIKLAKAMESQSLLPRFLPQDDEGSGGSVAPEEDEATSSKGLDPSCVTLLCVTV